MSDISILKLMDGTTIVGRLTQDGDLVEIEHPIELVSNIQPVGNILGEQVSLRPYVAIAQEHIFTIERYNVINISTLQENFVEGYERMVENIYFREQQWEGDLMSEDPDSELDMETMSDLADAIIKKQIHQEYIMAKRRDPNSAHYIDNKEFLAKISAYREERIEAEESGDERPQVTNYIGECFVKIANHLAYKSNFVNYTFRDEMILDGIENCLTYMDNFDPAKSKNPFAYFTQITYYAFIRRIQKEKRQMETKFKYIKSLDIDQILEQSADGSEHSNDYLSYMRGMIEQAEADNLAADKANAGKKMPKRRPKYLDERIKAEEAAAKEKEENGQPNDEIIS